MSAQPHARSLARLLPLALLALLALAPSAAEAGTRRTTFDPTRHGFDFINDFSNDFVKALDIRTGGLCGGMVYTALDYFNARTPIPRQDYRPANRTPLQSYLYNRQVQSLAPNIPKWANMGLNPDGARNGELFRNAAGREFALLKSKIDAGSPIPLGVHGVGGVTHQILAIGYKQGTSLRDLEIYVYDPNIKNKIITMRSRPDRAYFYYDGYMGGKERERYQWRTFFADAAYRPARPPAIRDSSYPSDGRVHELLLHMQTGDDDLRGGNDNVNLTLHLADGSRIARPNINLGARWLSNYTEFASVKLPRPVAKTAIRAVELTTTFRGGIGGDNWDLKSIVVDGYTGGARRERLTSRSAFFRFTGSRRSLRLDVASATPPARPGRITHLRLEIKTGGDDLRGNNDNVHAAVLLRSGARQLVQTINARQRWEDGATKTVDLRLDRPVERSAIVGVELRTTFRGGMGGDNWNVAALRVVPLEGGTKRAEYYFREGRPLHRFTARSQVFAARW